MKYCVYQVDESADEKIIMNLDNDKNFLERIKQMIGNQFSYQILENLSVDDVKFNNSYKEDFYLLANGKQIQLVRKIQKIIKGYFYNIIENDVDILFIWKIVPFELKKIILDSSSDESDASDASDSESDHILDKNNSEGNKKEFIVNDKDKIIFSEFDLGKMSTNPALCIIGKRFSGKTWTIADILDKLNTNEEFMENTTIVCRNERLAPFYGIHYPKAQISYEYNEDIIKQCLYRQADRIKIAKEIYEQTGVKISTNGCIILDDCLHPAEFKKGNNAHLYELLMNGRHYNLSVILTMQYSMGMPADIRLNFDYIVLCSEDSIINQKKLWHNYARMIPSFQQFHQVFGQMTKDYSTMLINNRCPSHSIYDKLFYFKANGIIARF